MPKPVIFTIDDDAAVLNSVERDLRAHYGEAQASALTAVVAMINLWNRLGVSAH